MGARFDRDLEALFRDLPKPAPTGVVVARGRGRRRRRAGLSSTVLLIVPLLVLAVVASIALHGPIFFGPIVWLLVLGHMGRHQRHRCGLGAVSRTSAAARGRCRPRRRAGDRVGRLP